MQTTFDCAIEMPAALHRVVSCCRNLVRLKAHYNTDECLNSSYKALVVELLKRIARFWNANLRQRAYAPPFQIGKLTWWCLIRVR